MAQADYSIANQGFPATRAEINSTLEAIATNNSGASAPSTQYAGQFWIDTTSSTWTMYIHDGTDDIQFATIDTSANTVNFIDSALDVVNDTTPQLGGNLDLNSNDITGTGNIDNVGTITTDGLTVAGNVSIDGGTIKLDGNYPVGTNNVALGDGALDDGSLTGGCNVAVGTSALGSNTTGTGNTALGVQTLLNNEANYSTAIGFSALKCNTGGSNVAIGKEALTANTTGSINTAVGREALYSNTTASNNTAVGHQSLYSNTTGCRNTAMGSSSLCSNTTGNDNTAIGNSSILANTTGCKNTALGYGSLNQNTTADNNTAVGYFSLLLNTTGERNTAVGVNALPANTSACNNTAVGHETLLVNTTGSENTAIGRTNLKCNTTGGSNAAIGYQTLLRNTTGSNNTAIGRNALLCNTTGSANFGAAFSTSNGTYAPVFNPSTHNNRIVMGHTSVTNAYVKVAWTVTSDCRDKMNIAPVPHGLDFVNQLNPVSFQFKKDRNTEIPNGDKRYGFLAQDILALEGDDNVIIDNEVEDSLKYKGEHLVPVLVNAIKELKSEIDELKNK